MSTKGVSFRLYTGSDLCHAGPTVRDRKPGGGATAGLIEGSKLDSTNESTIPAEAWNGY